MRALTTLTASLIAVAAMVISLQSRGESGPGEKGHMVTTILEARVSKDRVPELKKIFDQAGTALPPAIVETSLWQDAKDPAVMRIVTVWRSRQDLDEMRQQPEKPKGVQMFEAVGATPVLSIYDVVAQHRH